MVVAATFGQKVLVRIERCGNSMHGVSSLRPDIAEAVVVQWEGFARPGLRLGVK